MFNTYYVIEEGEGLMIVDEYDYVEEFSLCEVLYKSSFLEMCDKFINEYNSKNRHY